MATVSYSRLMAYKSCPKMYEHRYILGTDSPKDIQDYFLLGSLSHKIIEEFLHGSSKDLAIDLAMPWWLESQCQIPYVIADTKEQVPPNTINLSLLEEYCKKYGQLLLRCMECYLEDDKIRNKDGSCPKDPANFPPLTLTQQYNSLGLAELKYAIDTAATRAHSAYRRFSLANTAARAVAYALGFRIPEWVGRTIGIEEEVALPKPVYLKEGLSWNGARDWVVETVDGKIAIIDLKTEKDKILPENSPLHLQLNLYSYLRLETHNKLPDYIGIYHLPSGDLILGKVDVNVVVEAQQYLKHLQEKIDRDTEQDTFSKSWPTLYGSPCLRRDYKTGAISQVCPYITKCWPEYATTYIGQELDIYWGNS